MPISAEEVIQKSLNKGNAYQNLDMEEFGNVLGILNVLDQSYLKEELTKFTDAIRVIRRPHDYKKVEIQAAIKTLNEDFGNFLKDGVGKTNYQRLLDDCKLTMDYKNDGPEVIQKGIQFLTNYLGLDYKLEDLQAAQPKPGEVKEVRELRTTPVANYEDLMQEMGKGKNFLEATSKEGNLMRKAIESMKAFAKKIEGQIQTREVKDIPSATTLKEGFEKYATALDTIYTYSHKPTKTDAELEEKKAKLNDAIKTMGGFKDFLMEGNPPNYVKWENSGFDKKALDNVITLTNKTLGLGVDLKQIKRIAENQKTITTGDRFIDYWKKEVKNMDAAGRQRDDYPAKQMARVFATRILTNSVPGSLESLKKKVSLHDIEKKAAELAKNENFKSFIEEIKADPKKLKAVESDFKSAYSHGGGIEKMFKDHLLHLPAGKLQSDAVLDRFMPTVLDRIEVLQDQAKEALKQDKNHSYVPKREMAEVLLLRHEIGVGQNQKDALKVKIPTEKNFLKNVDKLANSHEFHNNFAVKAENVKKFYAGHGGKMASEYNQLEGQNPQANAAPKVPGLN